MGKSRLRTIVLWLGALLFLGSFSFSNAANVSSSAEEVLFEFETSFRSLSRERLNNTSAQKAAEFHAAHVYGIFHTPEIAEKYGYPAELIEGFAGTKEPVVSKVESFSVEEDDYQWVRYKATGRMLLLKPVLHSWLKDKNSGTVQLPLLKDLPAIYSDDGKKYRSSKWKECTDSHYWQAVEFSYFYNPVRCPDLAKKPIAEKVDFLITKQSSSYSRSIKFPRELLNSENENGKVVALYFVTGFDNVPSPGSPTNVIHRDAGWKTYQFIKKLFTDTYGFVEAESESRFRDLMKSDMQHVDLITPIHMNHNTQRRYFSTFVKRTHDKIYVVRSGLFSTHNERSSSPLRSFPKFWKEAWENGDLIYFGGHSGDGQALSLDNLLNNLNSIDLSSIQIKKNKTQLAVFDSCSSYAYYEEPYLKLKGRNVHLLTFGLVSLFHFAEVTLRGVVDIILNPVGQSPTWESALREIEEQMLPVHVTHTYEPKERESVLKKFQKRKLRPTSLMSATVSDHE